MNLGPRFYWNLPITNLYWVFIFQGYLILHHLNMTLGQLKSEWSVSRCHPHSSQQVRTFERSASSQDHPGAVCLSCHCSPLPTRRKRNVFIYFCLNIHPLSTSYEFFWFKKKNTERWGNQRSSAAGHLCNSTTVGLVFLNSSCPWHLLPLPLYAKQSTPAHKVTPKSALRSLLPQSGTVGGHLSPASISFPQEDKPVSPWALISLRRNETLAQHNFASI